MDDVHRGMFHRMADDAWLHGLAAAVDLTLLNRYYERFADHVLHVADCVIFLATGADAGM